MEVIHQSTKCFWKQKCTLDICIINHWTREVLEVRAFEATIAMESEPLYINKTILNAVIDKKDITSRIKELKEPLLRRREAIDEVAIEKRARNEVVSDIILNRLHVEKFSVEPPELSISVVATVCDMEKGRPDMVCACPNGLTYFSWDHAKKTMSFADVVASLDVLSTDMESLHKQSSQAAKYEETARSVLTVKERWRLALVFGKVAKGRRLSAGDAKIWDIVSKNLEKMADGSNKASSAMGHSAEYWERRLRSKRPTTPTRSNHRAHSPSLTPRESVAKTITAQKGYSVIPTEGYTPGVGAGGLNHSLEHSLANVPGTSMNTTNKCYRSAASLDLDDSANSPRGGGGLESQLSFNRSLSREHSGINERIGQTRAQSPNAHTSRTHSIRQHSPRRSSHEEHSGGGGAFGDHSGAGGVGSRSNSVSHSRPQSASIQHAHAKLAKAPINNTSTLNSADSTPKAKRKPLNPPKPESACDSANKQLLAARMLRSLAAASMAVSASIRSSFSGSMKVKVYVDTAATEAKSSKTPKSCNTVSTTSSSAAAAVAALSASTTNSPNHPSTPSAADSKSVAFAGADAANNNNNSNSNEHNTKVSQSVMRTSSEANSFSVRKLLRKLTIGKSH